MPYNVSVNGYNLNTICKITGVSRPILPEREINLITVPGVDGAYFQNVRTKERKTSIEVVIFGKTLAEIRANVKILGNILNTKEPVPIIFADEPDCVYYGILDGTTDFDTMAVYGRGTITFVHPDPYWYSTEEKEQVINDPNDPTAANPIIVNEGMADTPPVIVAEVLQPLTFLDIIASDEYMRIGNPYTTEQTLVEGEEHVLWDELQTTTGWGSATQVVGGIVQGTMVSDGNTFVASSFGSTSTGGWAGPALKKSLPNARQLQDFRVHSLVQIESSAKGTGRIEVYGLDTSNNILFRMSIGDFSASTKNVKAFWQLGPGEKTILETYGKKTGDFNNYYGALAIERRGNKWTVYTAKRDKTEISGYSNYIKKTFIDSENKYMAKLAQVQVHIGKHMSYETAPHLSCNHMFVYGLDTVPSANEVPYLAYPGDEIIFDHKGSAIYLNGEPILWAKDFAASFFKLAQGATQLAVYPDDVAKVTVKWRERGL